MKTTSNARNKYKNCDTRWYMPRAAVTRRVIVLFCHAQRAVFYLTHPPQLFMARDAATVELGLGHPFFGDGASPSADPTAAFDVHNS
jgi:hypothetical protein